MNLRYREVNICKNKKVWAGKIVTIYCKLAKHLPVQQGDLKKRLALTEVQYQAKVARPIPPPVQSMAKCHPENSMTSIKS